jgi:hypothetical protein
MKSIAVFIILNVLLLSSFTGMANIRYGKASCCITKMKKDCCKQSKHDFSDDCAKGNCNAMLSCGTCGFVIAASLSISPTACILSGVAVHYFSIGELSDYHDNDWNPPKV